VEKHGTCAQNLFNEHDYFQAALCLRSQLCILDALSSAGISPDGRLLHVGHGKGHDPGGTGYAPYVDCNRDESSNTQVYFCVAADASGFVECPSAPAAGRAATRSSSRPSDPTPKELYPRILSEELYHVFLIIR
jgi:ribonuclease T2